MQNKTGEEHYFQNNEIDLRKLFSSLVPRIPLIVSITVLVTLVAIFYALNLTPSYKATSSFVLPSESSLSTINKSAYTSQTRESVFTNFLTKLMSQKVHRDVFLEGDFLTKFDLDKISIKDADNFIITALNSIEVKLPNLSKSSTSYLTEPVYSVEMSGTNPNVIADYIDQLVATANAQNIDEIVNLSKLKISYHIDEMLAERKLLLNRINNQKKAEIERIKKLNAVEINTISNNIDRVRVLAKESRLNMIDELNESILLARSLGIIENNFLKLEIEDYNFTINMGDSEAIPLWYLYGEKTLVKRVEVLKNRSNDDPFIPELITLKNQLNEAQNNNKLATLESNIETDPFVGERLIYLDLELKNHRELANEISIDDSLSSIQIVRNAKIDIFQKDKKLIILLALVVGLIGSILIALFVNLFKND